MYSYQVNISAQEHDEFVAKHPLANLFQSSQWALVKEDWGNLRVGFYQNGTMQGAASLLIRPLPLGRSMIYIPRGPIMDYEDEQLVPFVLKSLKEIAKTQKALFIKFDPFIFLHQTFQQEQTHNASAHDIIQRLTQAGAEWLGQTTDMSETVQPRFQANLYAETFGLEHLSKNARQSIRTSNNKGVEICFGGQELLEDFAGLMKKTENRKSIHLRNIDYYRLMMDTYADNAYITMAYLDIPKRTQQLTDQKSSLEKTLRTFSEDTRQTKITSVQADLKRINEELEFLAPFLQGGPSKIPLAATLSLEYAGTSENLYAGMDDRFKRYQAPINVWFETTRHSFERGNRWMNMGGVENTLDGGLYAFKSKFSPTIEEFIGEFNIPVSPFYRLAMFAYNKRKQSRNNH